MQEHSDHELIARYLRGDEQSLVVWKKSVLISADTVVRIHGGRSTSTDLAAGDEVVAIGAPNERGEIAAKFIRAFRPSQ